MNVDFVAEEKEFVFETGINKFIYRVSILMDDLNEVPESFDLCLNSDNNRTIIDAFEVHTVIIEDDDSKYNG